MVAILIDGMGKFFWTCGGKLLWFAFFWWDRSGDARSNSNSGFYVKGFEFHQKQEAFEHACEVLYNILESQFFSTSFTGIENEQSLGCFYLW